MQSTPLTVPHAVQRHESRRATRVRLERWAALYARVALGTAFLSSVAARFGLWGARSSWRNFGDFTRYTAEVNSFMPAASIPFLAWVATAAELSLGIALIIGVRLRSAAVGSAILLALFGTAMAVSLGIKSPLDYSVFSASAGALLLALHEPHGASPCESSSAPTDRKGP
jgi:putative oxidoreductase